MNNLIDNLIYYKRIHPIRFWLWIFAILICMTLLFFLIKHLFDKKKENKISISDSDNGEFELYEKTSLKKQEKEMFFESKTFYHLCFLVLGIFIGSLSTSIISNYGNVNENTSISNSKYLFGIDVSQYQGNINWAEVRTSHHPIEYVFIRATMGRDGKDSQFKTNWSKAKKHKYVRGAYHYYRPNENSKEQFNNFSASVTLNKGDFPPILDIEKQSKLGTASLRKGVLNWLKLAEEKYKIKPVIYTGRTFYENYLKGHVKDYPLWIASYSSKNKLKNIDWTFHQFTENVKIKGIKHSVDGNDYNADLIDLLNMCIK